MPEPLTKALKRILVVDDELHVAASITVTLEGAGYQIEAVSDGLKAFEILAQNMRLFELVIVDDVMPGLTGSELIKKLQETGFQGNYIVLAAYVSPELEAVYRGLGVNYIIRKPFDLAELRLAVAETAQAIRDESQ